MCDSINHILKDIDESKITKLPNLCVPSFNMAFNNQQLSTSKTTISLSTEVGGFEIKGGC
jgi:hypothetical protein